MSRIVDTEGGWKAFYEHVARAPIAAKTAPGSWHEWYDRAWSPPGTGGKESDVATRKRRPTGDAGAYANASCHRWFLDGADRTSSPIVGRTVRSCRAYDRAHDADGEYVDLTLPRPRRTPPPDRRGHRPYPRPAPRRLRRHLGPRLPDVHADRRRGPRRRRRRDRRPARRRLHHDGGPRPGHHAHRHRAEGEPGRRTAVVRDPGRPPTGAHRLVNRHSGLVPGLSAHSGRLAGTAPARTCSDPGGSAVGRGRTAAEQTPALTPDGDNSGPPPGSRA
ncbi:hypothetical protein [Streptomyces sp. KHY 26]|uniref:hypothetical protein n=1 Tax=Streptomyces sp. KHY 26 TaxID=3097359 RepID=UPI00376EA694